VLCLPTRQAGGRQLWLERAFALDEKKELKLMALDDPDLEPLWKNIGGLET
jgi:hypothetical protein